jgi:hypothetical protein
MPGWSTTPRTDRHLRAVRQSAGEGSGQGGKEKAWRSQKDKYFIFLTTSTGKPIVSEISKILCFQ